MSTVWHTRGLESLKQCLWFQYHALFTPNSCSYRNRQPVLTNVAGIQLSSRCKLTTLAAIEWPHPTVILGPTITACRRARPSLFCWMIVMRVSAACLPTTDLLPHTSPHLHLHIILLHCLPACCSNAHSLPPPRYTAAGVPLIFLPPLSERSQIRA